LSSGIPSVVGILWSVTALDVYFPICSELTNVSDRRSSPPGIGRTVQIPAGQLAEIFANVKPGIPLLGKGGVDATSRNIAQHPLKVADGVVGSSHR